MGAGRSPPNRPRTRPRPLQLGPNTETFSPTSPFHSIHASTTAIPTAEITTTVPSSPSLRRHSSPSRAQQSSGHEEDTFPRFPTSVEALLSWSPTGTFSPLRPNERGSVQQQGRSESRATTADNVRTGNGILPSDRQHRFNAVRVRSRSTPSSARDSVSSIRPLWATSPDMGESMIPRRHATLNLYPQHLFPSDANWLQLALPGWKNLEVPYAFSHKDARFYWTQDDALRDWKWNVWARPPCLNCHLSGEDMARRCDQVKTREDSFGFDRACWRCKAKGEAESCVEMIERRADGSVGVDGHDIEKKDMGLWEKREMRLRKQERVWWTPVNLESGDIVGKRRVLDAWEIIQDDRFRHVQKNWVLPDLSQYGRDAPKLDFLHQEEERVRRLELTKDEKGRQEVTRIKVVGWNVEDAFIESIKRQSEEVRKDPTEMRRQLWRLRKKAEAELEASIAKQQEFWIQRIRAERALEYRDAVRAFGTKVANEQEDLWSAGDSEMLNQVSAYIDAEARLREENARWEGGEVAREFFSGRVVDRLQCLVPPFCRSVGLQVEDR